MQYELKQTETFKKSLAKSLKKFPESIEDINTQIDSIPLSLPGNACTLFTSHDMRKVRFALKKYKIGKSGGLRLF